MGSSSWLFSNSRSSATPAVQQLPLFSNSRCSATPSIEQLPLLNNSLFSNSVFSATQSVQQLHLFSNSFSSATLSVQRFRCSESLSIWQHCLFSNSVCPSCNHFATFCF